MDCEFIKFCKDENIGDASELAILPVQRSMRYAILLDAIRKEAEKLNKAKTETIHSKTLGKLTGAITEVKKFNMSINEKRRLIDMFSADKAVADYFIKHNNIMSKAPAKKTDEEKNYSNQK